MAMLERDRWERLQPFLDRALELSGEQRLSWLISLRTTDPDVVDELESLLSEDAAADRRGFLGTSPSGLASRRRETQGSRGGAERAEETALRVDMGAPTQHSSPSSAPGDVP